MSAGLLIGCFDLIEIIASGLSWLTRRGRPPVASASADLQRRQVGEAEIGIAVGHELQRIGRPGAFANGGDVDARLRKVALVARHEEHRMVAAHQPVELHRDIVRGLCNAGTHRPDAGDRKHPPYPFADHHD
jgi:hypothetical protein